MDQTGKLIASRAGRDYFIDEKDFEDFMRRTRTDKKDDDKQ